MSAAEDLIAAVIAGDADQVKSIVSADPTLASTHDGDGVSVLMLSRYRSIRDVTDALLAAGPDLDIHEAAALGYIDRLRERLEEDPTRVGSFSADGYTALHLAAFFAKPEAARVLLEAGAPVDAVARNETRVQPLHSPAAGRQTEIGRLLLAAGADVNARQAGGFTPLHAAAQNGDPEMVELFLSAGADTAATTDDRRTSADIAEASGHPDVAHRLHDVADSDAPEAEPGPRV